MLNITLINNTIKCLLPDCVKLEQCKAICLTESKAFTYEFVWLFVIAFIFGQIPYFLMNDYIKIKPEIRTNLMRGFKLASYLLNLAGVLWFLLII